MPAANEAKPFHSLKEISVLAVSAVAIYLLIALFTFNPEDAGWTHSSHALGVTNAGGFIGAWLSDFCLSFFGIAGYAIPFVAIRHSYITYAARNDTNKNNLLVLHWLGSIFTLLASAALFYLHVLRTGVELPGNSGGIIGQETGDLLLRLCGNSGATLLLIAIILAGITMTTQLSWLRTIDYIGKYSIILFDFVGKHVLVALDLLVNKASSINLKPIQTPAFATSYGEPATFEKPASRPPRPERSQAAPAYFEAAFDLPKRSTEETGATLQSPTFIRPNETEAVVPSFSAMPQKSQAPQVSPAKKKPLGNVLPSPELLDNRDTRVKGYTQTDLEEMSRLVEDILADFNVSVEVVGFLPGPVITRFEIQPAAGVKVARISSLSKDLARALSVTSVRIVEVIPGKSVIGLEIPNREREMVNLRELLVSRTFDKAPSLLTLAMGKDISGQPLVADLGKMPHALVAGTTGSGKSVRHQFHDLEFVVQSHATNRCG